MAEEEQEVEVTKLSDKVLQQLKKAFGMSAEDKFEARKIHKYAGAAAGKATKIGGAALVGGAKGMFAGISKMFKSGWWIALFPFFYAIKWIFKGVMAIIKLPIF